MVVAEFLCAYPTAPSTLCNTIVLGPGPKVLLEAQQEKLLILCVVCVCVRPWPSHVHVSHVKQG